MPPRYGSWKYVWYRQRLRYWRAVHQVEVAFDKLCKLPAKLQRKIRYLMMTPAQKEELRVVKVLAGIDKKN